MHYKLHLYFVSRKKEFENIFKLDRNKNVVVKQSI